MTSLKFEKTGSFDELSLVNIDKPILRPGEALVRVRAAGINGSDAAGIIGTLPFSFEALDASGASSQEWIGAEVWGTGSDRGFHFGWNIFSHDPAVVCAWITVDTLAKVKEGDNVIIIGARGGIGSAAAQLCKERGHIYRHVHLARQSDSPHHIHSTTRFFTMTPNGTGRVVDGLFPVNLRSFYTKALTLKGMKSSILGPLEVKEVLDDLAKKIDSGLLEGRRRNMDNVKGALQEILTRASHVRSVIVPEHMDI
ncbi:hypothetical protein F4604DRAFT_1817632 [Suillus subluteus]|nr:hypothetical protein F4604DRAFT_1817632 [Suillus subluteus]